MSSSELPASPAASQSVALGQATVSSSANESPAGSGTGWMVSDEPSQRSASASEPWRESTAVPASAPPTSVQAVGLEHATSSKPALSLPAGIGTVSVDQVVPTMRSASGLAMVPDRYAPTAMQFDASPQETPPRNSCFEPAGVGGVTFVHDTPSHRWMIAC